MLEKNRPSLADAMRLTPEQIKEVHTVARSLYVFSEGLKAIDSIDQLNMLAANISGIAETLRRYAEWTAQNGADDYMRKIGLKPRATIQ